MSRRDKYRPAWWSVDAWSIKGWLDQQRKWRDWLLGKGVTMAVRHYCENCGHELGRQYRSCPNCGRPRPSEAGLVAPTDRTDYLDANIHLRRLAALGVALVSGALLMGVLALLGVLLGVGGVGPEPGVIGFFASFAVAVYLMDKINKTGEGRSTPTSRAPPVRSHRAPPVPSRSIPQWVKIAVATRDGGKCRRCGGAYDLQYDHVIPFSRGGSSTDVNNIQLLCGKCNRLKSNRYIG